MSPTGRTSGKTAERFDDGAQSEGIESPIYFNVKLSAQAKADTRSGSLNQPAGDQLKETAGARLLRSKPTPPGIEKEWFDLGVSAIGGNAHTACRLVLYDGAPMGPSFRSGHLSPPDNEDFSFSGSIAERRTVEKMGWSDAYITTS
ncbi:MAG: hypothetical protein V1791_10730 [Pseudomonadota bacterium]